MPKIHINIIQSRYKMPPQGHHKLKDCMDLNESIITIRHFNVIMIGMNELETKWWTQFVCIVEQMKRCVLSYRVYIIYLKYQLSIDYST